jgi:hypothetical protein
MFGDPEAEMVAFVVRRVSISRGTEQTDNILRILGPYFSWLVTGIIYMERE